MHASPPPPPPAYLAYVRLVEFVGELACIWASIPLLVALLYRVHFLSRSLATAAANKSDGGGGGGLSRSMRVFLWFHLLNCVVCWPYEVYMLALWEAPTVEYVQHYSVDWMFWLGTFAANYMAVAPANLFVLTLDRCLTLRFGAGAYRAERTKRAYTAASVTLLAALYALSECFFLAELPLDERAMVSCEDMPCTMRKYRALPQLTLKIVFATLNLFAIVYFLALERKRQFNINDRVVKMTVLTEMALSIIPGYFSVSFSIIVGESSANYFGAYVWLFATMDCLICALYYSRVLIWRRWRRRRREEVDNTTRLRRRQCNSQTIKRTLVGGGGGGGGDGTTPKPLLHLDGNDADDEDVIDGDDDDANSK